VPITRWRFLSFRALGFWDTGYIGNHFQRTSGDRDYLPTQLDGTHWWRNDVGVGLRIYVSSIVLPLLGLDFGYGLEARELQIYLAIGLTD
jgi:outer membrane translocation and assembly module TamA